MMNIYSALKCLVCCLTLVALGTIARGEDIHVSNHGDKQAAHPVATYNEPPIKADSVPEPSTGSLILLSLGGLGLALKLRKRP